MAPKEDAANQSKAAGDSSLCHLSIPPLPPLNAGEIALLPNQSWVCLASNSKADLLTLGCGMHTVKRSRRGPQELGRVGKPKLTSISSYFNS